MNKDTLIALGGGGVSAVATLAFQVGVPGLVLFYLAPLPLLLVGLGYGSSAATLACLAGIAVAGVLGELMFGLVFALIHALPAWIVARLALLRRVDENGTERWYPVGGILAVLAAIGAAMLAITALAAQSAGGFAATVTKVLTFAFENVMVGIGATDADRLVEMMAAYFPGMVTFSWVLMALANAMLAQRLLVKQGRNLRPRPVYSALTLPDWLSWAIVGAAALALMDGDLGYFGFNAVVALATPFFFLGLAVVHVLARRLPQPGVMLGVFYLVLVFSGPTALLVAGVGLIEQWLGVRHRVAGPPDCEENE